MEKKGSRSTLSRTTENVISFRLGDLSVALSSNTSLIGQFASEFLQDWLSTSEGGETAESFDIHIHLELVEKLPPLPPQNPIFRGGGRHLRDQVGSLFVFEESEGYLLYFQDGGLVNVQRDNTDQVIEGYITTALVRYGRLHDLLFTSLSYCLRRRGYYMVHAAAAARDQKAILFVGAPGCGKSTTVLNLALNGWDVLSNDTLLLVERPGGIYALPTPGGFSIRPKSIAYIPTLAAHLPEIMPDDFYHLSLNSLGLRYAEPTLISTIYFPEIQDGEKNYQTPIPPAMTLARLIEFSLDKWDGAKVPAHITFLEKLSRQAISAELNIRNQREIPDLVMHKT